MSFQDGQIPSKANHYEHSQRCQDNPEAPLAEFSLTPAILSNSSSDVGIKMYSRWRWWTLMDGISDIQDKRNDRWTHSLRFVCMLTWNCVAQQRRKYIATSTFSSSLETPSKLFCGIKFIRGPPRPPPCVWCSSKNERKRSRGTLNNLQKVFDSKSCGTELLSCAGYLPGLNCSWLRFLLVMLVLAFWLLSCQNHGILSSGWARTFQMSPKVLLML